MTEVRKLTEDEVQDKLTVLAGWQLVEGKLHREIKFGDFVEAFSFMTAVAILAEKANHHPEWSNVYSRLVIDLQTHEVGGISDLDFDLAVEINKKLD